MCAVFPDRECTGNVYPASDQDGLSVDRPRRGHHVFPPLPAAPCRRPQGPHLDRPSPERPGRSGGLRHAPHHLSGEKGGAPIKKSYGQDRFPAPGPPDPLRHIQDHYHHDAACAASQTDHRDPHVHRGRPERDALAHRSEQAAKVLGRMELYEVSLSRLRQRRPALLVVQQYPVYGAAVKHGGCVRKVCRLHGVPGAVAGHAGRSCFRGLCSGHEGARGHDPRRQLVQARPAPGPEDACFSYLSRGPRFLPGVLQAGGVGVP